MIKKFDKTQWYKEHAQKMQAITERAKDGMTLEFLNANVYGDPRLEMFEAWLTNIENNISTIIETLEDTAEKAKFLRLDDVLKIIPISKSSWWAGVASGEFPASVSLGSRTTAWRSEDIQHYIKNVVANPIKRNLHKEKLKKGETDE